MAGVAGSQVGSDLQIAVLPEGGEIARDRDWSPCRRQQVQNDRHTTVRDGWSGSPAEDLLQLHCENRRLGTVVREPNRGTRRDLEPFRCELAKPACRGPWQELPERRSHVDVGKIA